MCMCNLTESVFSFHHMGPEVNSYKFARTFFLLCHLTGSRTIKFKELNFPIFICLVVPQFI